jgi:hypothetical protein
VETPASKQEFGDGGFERFWCRPGHVRDSSFLIELRLNFTGFRRLGSTNVAFIKLHFAMQLMCKPLSVYR